MKRIATVIATLILAAGTAAAKDQTRSFKPHKFNGSKPAYSKGVYTFTLEPRGCSARKYGDGRGESDCFNGSLRSRVKAPKNVAPGATMEYYMEFRMNPGFRYDGGRTPGYSKLEVAEWGRVEGIKNHVYDLQLDTVRGLTFERAVCVPPNRLSEWNSVRVLVKWSKTGDGFLQAICNGTPVLTRQGQQTVIPPDCAKPWKLQCEPSLQRPDARIYWQVGPKLSGHGASYRKNGFSSAFARFPPNGVQMQVRNLYAGRPIKR